MGQILSYLQPEPEVNEVVLVPPLFERDHKGRSRLAKSSYDFLFCKPNLRWLFNDYLPCGLKSLLHFSPPEDPRVSVTVRLGADAGLGDSIRDVHIGDLQTGSATLRFQSQPTQPLDFFDVKVYTQAEGAARVRGCYFHPGTGLGVFGAIPIVAAGDGGSMPDARLGLRYSTATTSLGAVIDPFLDSVTQLWAVARNGPLTVGVQVEPPPGFSGRGVRQMWEDLPTCSSVAFSYSPSGAPVGRGQFTAALEVQQQRRLCMSFLHHMAVQRLCKNPFEEKEVVGITNYLDFGLQIVTGLAKGQSAGGGSLRRSSAADDADANQIRLGVAWQANKNLLLKARVGTDAAVASVAFKAWWQPSFTFALSGGYDLALRAPRAGFVFNVENYGNIRYERGQRVAFGGALVQRHVALPQDLANREGKGLLVQKDDLDNARILGQTTSEASFVL